MSKLSEPAKNYLKDVFKVNSISKIPIQAMHTIIENVELTADPIDKEIMVGFFAAKGLPVMNSDQFRARILCS